MHRRSCQKALQEGGDELRLKGDGLAAEMLSSLRRAGDEKKSAGLSQSCRIVGKTASHDVPSDAGDGAEREKGGKGLEGVFQRSAYEQLPLLKQKKKTKKKKKKKNQKPKKTKPPELVIMSSGLSSPLRGAGPLKGSQFYHVLSSPPAREALDRKNTSTGGAGVLRPENGSSLRRDTREVSQRGRQF